VEYVSDGAFQNEYINLAIEGVLDMFIKQ